MTAGKTLVVELYGGPGIGKTTTASKLFATLKDHKVYSTELVGEYVKTWAWEGKHPSGIPDQVYLFAKQLRAESRLYGKVDIVVTDAPIVLMPFYAQKYIGRGVSQSLLKLYDEMRYNEPNVCRLRVLLERTKDYDTRGRFQTALEAEAIDVELREFLDDSRLTYYERSMLDSLNELVLRCAEQVHS